jgi:hypothetical protein
LKVDFAFLMLIEQCEDAIWNYEQLLKMNNQKNLIDQYRQCNYWHSDKKKWMYINEHVNILQVWVLKHVLYQNTDKFTIQFSIMMINISLYSRLFDVEIYISFFITNQINKSKLI